MVLFNVASARELAARCAKLDPGARYARRRSWVADPGAGGEGLLARLANHAGPRQERRACPATGVWFWESSEEELLARANAILLHFVHPLVARGLPYRIGFPFDAEASSRRPP